MLKILVFPDFLGPPFLKLSPFPADNSWDNLRISACTFWRTGIQENHQ